MEEMTVAQLMSISCEMDLDSNEHLVLPQALVALQEISDIKPTPLFNRVMEFRSVQKMLKDMIQERLPSFCLPHNEEVFELHKKFMEQNGEKLTSSKS
ncbi:MAG: hypothetical protein CMP39_04165 [Rickettsiales bacterium]|nr:hypothetical protein [Rickettsiales bacterium]|tara:strand:- start:205 stop:498 length:294 start_codon:yes stop_codon:yes gene_type:complete